MTYEKFAFDSLSISLVPFVCATDAQPENSEGACGQSDYVATQSGRDRDERLWGRQKPE